MDIQLGDAATWAGAVVAVLAIAVSLVARRDGKRAVIEARRSSEAAEQSASTAREALELEQRRHHEDRRPRFTARLEWRGSERNVPYAVLAYEKGPDLGTIEVTLQRADGFREAIASFRAFTTWSIANVRPGGEYETPVSQPDKLGGRSWLVCRCVAPNTEEWPARPWIDVPAVGAGVELHFLCLGRHKFALQNVGSEAAAEVTVHADEEVTRRAQHLPERIRIEPGHACRFHIIDDASFFIPESLTVSWEGSGGAQSLPLPPSY